MGCTQSKIDNEEAVLRCKDRKQFMRSAVADRNAFAAAHFGFTVSLKNTGAALHEFGQGEVQDPVPSIQAASSVMEPTLPPPPPLPYQVPLQRAASMPELPIPKSDPKRTDTIQEEDDEFELENDDSNLIRRGGAGGRSAGRTAEVEAPPPLPSPPRNAVPNNPDPPPPLESKDNRWDYFFEPEIPRPSLSDPNEIRPDMDEGGSGVYDDRFHKKVNDVVDGDAGSKSGKVEPLMPERVVEAPVKKSKAIVNSQTAPTEAKRGGKARSNVNLSQILQELDEDFLKASESAHEVSKMLEANRLHYHSNFADNRGHIDHSARVMRVITWNRSFRGLTNADDGKDELDADEHETHASVLDKLLAWEKKLYDEVKAGELMKLEYQRKVSLLNKQKRRSTNSEALEKAKAAVSHLHTRYIVDMQSLDSTVAEINRLRDDHLYPRLVDLVDGMAKMWETMAIHHDRQLKIVADLRMLDYSHSPMETSDDHHKYTKQLCRAVGEWHIHLQKLVSYQKGYIRALNGWLKLNLIPIESSLKEKVSSPPRVHRPPIQALLLSWNEDLEKLPDDRARTSISNFSAIIEAIMHQQDEEVKLKMKCDETKKELTRKKRAFEDWHQKYKQRRTPPDEMDPEKTEDPNYQDPVIERQFVLENLEKRLEDEVETYQKHCQLVRDKSLSCLKMQLPELLRAISEFAHSCTEMYANLRSVPRSQNPTESSS